MLERQLLPGETLTGGATRILCERLLELAEDLSEVQE
jgi:hypothetical protein